MNIRNIVRIVCKQFNVVLTDSQIDTTVKFIKEDLSDEDKFNLKVQGKYVRVCKEHPSAIPKKEDELWICSVCGLEIKPKLFETFIKDSKKKLELPKKTTKESVVDRLSKIEYLKRIDSGKIDITKLSPARKAWITIWRKRLK